MSFGKKICIELATKRKTHLKSGLFGRKLLKGETPEAVEKSCWKESSILLCGL